MVTHILMPRGGVSKTRITDEINNKFPQVTDGTNGSTNFFSTINPSNPLATGLYPK